MENIQERLLAKNISDEHAEVFSEEQEDGQYSKVYVVQILAAHISFWNKHIIDGDSKHIYLLKWLHQQRDEIISRVVSYEVEKEVSYVVSQLQETMESVSLKQVVDKITQTELLHKKKTSVTT
tara:strand:- start:752 stop:1120 length:369 start_codon:yes stop_codon:yes gene_type:complete